MEAVELGFSKPELEIKTGLNSTTISSCLLNKEKVLGTIGLSLAIRSKTPDNKSKWV